MKYLRTAYAAGILALMLAAVAALTAPVAAHESREVGPYRIVVGWRSEPAYVGLPNGPEVFVSLKDDPSQRVEGTEETLRLTVIFGDRSRVLFLRPVFRDPGHYVADLIPTRPGDYTFHLTGSIEDTEIDEKFSSADGRFDGVEPVGDILFPDPALNITDLHTQIEALKAEIEALKNR